MIGFNKPFYSCQGYVEDSLPRGLVDAEAKRRHYSPPIKQRNHPEQGGAVAGVCPQELPTEQSAKSYRHRRRVLLQALDDEPRPREGADRTGSA